MMAAWLCSFIATTLTVLAPFLVEPLPDYRAIIGIANLGLMEGELPSRVLGLVVEWAELHHTELEANWENLQSTGSFSKIDPLV